MHNHRPDYLFHDSIVLVRGESGNKYGCKIAVKAVNQLQSANANKFK